MHKDKALRPNVYAFSGLCLLGGSKLYSKEPTTISPLLVFILKQSSPHVLRTKSVGRAFS